MIADCLTNKLYLSDCLPHKQPDFFPRFKEVLRECRIPIEFLPGTRDIWAVDFMPIQISENEFVQFTYDPDYLKPKKYHSSITDTDSVCEAIGIIPKKSALVVDGGNVIKGKDMVIMCDKVFYENPQLTEKEIIRGLESLFQVDKLVFIPWDRSDFTGHSDGMVRFIDDNTVLINDYSKESVSYQRNFRMALHNAGLEWIELPYNPYQNFSADSACRVYINFLQMQQAIIVPVFNSHFDEIALRVICEAFKGQVIRTVNSVELAEQGGILNCISWNIAVN